MRGANPADEMDEAIDNDDGLQNTVVIIPMLNEEDSIALVLADLLSVRKVLVVDNGSTDASARIAKLAGAEVVFEPQSGYGKACLKGIEHVDRELASSPQARDTAIVAFMDADYSDHPGEIVDVIGPIIKGDYDFVIGSRATGNRQVGAMPFQAIFGNWLACTLIRLCWGASYTDLGPFRAIRYTSLKSLGMQDEDYGWTIEMQIKAVRQGLRYTEVPVSYRRRIGTSKISGTISGTIRAGYKILYTITAQLWRS